MSFAAHFKYAVMVAIIGFSLLALSDGCTSQGDCEENEVCCNHQCIYGSSCVGQSCWYDDQCSSGETCCRHSCVSSSSCVGQYCSSDTDCSSEESCCNSQCHYSSDCIGFSCYLSYDCGDRETCCYGTCQNLDDSCVDISAAVIASSVIGSLVFICMISMCIFYAWRRGRPIQGRVILGQPVTATTTTTTRCATQGYPPYQQGHPYHPLPQSEQHQTANPPLYNPGTMAVSEQPPPYPTEPHRASGGVYAPKTSYGAIQSAPAVV